MNIQKTTNLIMSAIATDAGNDPEVIKKILNDAAQPQRSEQQEWTGLYVANVAGRIRIHEGDWKVADAHNAALAAAWKDHLARLRTREMEFQRGSRELAAERKKGLRRCPGCGKEYKMAEIKSLEHQLTTERQRRERTEFEARHEEHECPHRGICDLCRGKRARRDLLAAQAAIKKLAIECGKPYPSEKELNWVLEDHDAEVRKPLMEALEGLRPMLEHIKNGRWSDAGIEIINAALAQCREDK